jgi:Raf kinase inhibitor-like YbhB/YbcL family protein
MTIPEARGLRRWRRLGGWLAAMAVAGVALANGCGDDGRELRAPSSDQTTSTAPTTAPTSTAAEGGATSSTAATTAPLQLTSPAFAEGGPIPLENTCLGTDVSPALAWANVPASVVELAIVVRDADADGFVHWVIAGLPPSATSIAEGDTPTDAIEGLNDFGRVGWSGPCPPSGTHHYDFRLYALTGPSGLSPELEGNAAAQVVETAPVLASAALSGTAAAP